MSVIKRFNQLAQAIICTAKVDIGRVLIHEFLSWGNSYYEMKCSTGNLMGEHHYFFMYLLQLML